MPRPTPQMANHFLLTNSRKRLLQLRKVEARSIVKTKSNVLRAACPPQESFASARETEKVKPTTTVSPHLPNYRHPPHPGKPSALVLLLLSTGFLLKRIGDLYS